jgi:uncharacterized protein (TIGR00730 family)
LQPADPAMNPGIATLCVYCGSAVGVRPAHRAAGERLGRILAEREVRLVFGGGRVGLMGVIADAVVRHGGKVTGIIPTFLEAREVGHRGIDDLRIVDSMHVRKQLMFELSDAFAILPGGYGTLDETFEIITWRLLGMHDKPVVIVNQDGYWTPLIELIEHCRREGFASERRDLFHVVADVDEVLPAIARSAEPDRRVMIRPSRI